MDQIKRRRKLSNKQEQIATKELGLKMSPASGATMFGGGDGRLAGQIRLECKFTEADFYTLKLEELLKLRKQAIKGGLEQPIFQVEFKGNYNHKAKYAIVPSEDYCDPGLIWERTNNKQIKLVAQDLYENLDPKLIVFNQVLAIGENPIEWKFTIYEWNEYLRRQGLDDRD